MIKLSGMSYINSFAKLNNKNIKKDNADNFSNRTSKCRVCDKKAVAALAALTVAASGISGCSNQNPQKFQADSSSESSSVVQVETSNIKDTYVNEFGTVVTEFTDGTRTEKTKVGTITVTTCHLFKPECGDTGLATPVDSNEGDEKSTFYINGEDTGVSAKYSKTDLSEKDKIIRVSTDAILIEKYDLNK